MCDAHVSSNSLNRDETRFGIFFPFFYFTPFLILLLQRGRKRETKALVLVLLTAAVIDEWKFVFCSSATKWFPLFLLFVWHRPFLNESTLRSTHAGKKKKKKKMKSSIQFSIPIPYAKTREVWSFREGKTSLRISLEHFAPFLTARPSLENLYSNLRDVVWHYSVYIDRSATPPHVWHLVDKIDGRTRKQDESFLSRTLLWL